MDLRFNPDEDLVLRQAATTFRRFVPPQRILDGTSTAGAWARVASDGWLDVLRGPNADLPLVAGIGREAGRVLGGDGFVTNAVLLAGARTDGPLPPGFLVADGRGETLVAGPGTTPWCFGVEDGIAAYLIDDDGTLTLAEQWTVKAAAPAALGVGTIATARATPVGELELGPELLRTARTIHAATLVGLAEEASAIAVEHARQRVQFSSPIGAFQAVKHLLVDAVVLTQIAWEAVLHAALRPSDRAVDCAALQAKRAADLATRTATQVLGGMAMTWEHPLHLYLKAGQAGRERFGHPDDLATRVGAALMAGAEG